MCILYSLSFKSFITLFQIIKNKLKKYNITDVDCASNGQEAIEKYKKNKYDFVTMDITMDKMNGLDALKEITRFDPNAKVIMCSSMGQQCLILEAIKYGAIDFVVKPFTDEKIDEIINRFKNFKAVD